MYRLNREALSARVASSWLKRSGMLEAPPRMVQSISDWVSEHLEGGSTPLEPGGKAAKRFPLDFRGWKYGDRLKEVMDFHFQRLTGVREMIKRRVQEDPALGTEMLRGFLQDVEKDLAQGRVNKGPLVHVVYPVRPSNTGGAWTPLQGTLTVYLRDYHTPRHIRRIVEHELRHAAQTWLSEAILSRKDDLVDSLQGLAGLPSKRIRTPGMKQSPGGGGAYYLDDLEFYPNLADAIDRMREVLDHPRVSAEQRPESFKMLVGLKRIRGSWRDHNVDSLDPFFLALKHGSREKYRKALSEAYKALF